MNDLNEVEALLSSIEIPHMKFSVEERVEELRRASRPRDRGRVPRRRRLAIAAAGAGVLAVAVAGGVVATAHWREPQDRDLVTCFAVDDSRPQSELTSMDVMLARDPTEPDAASIAASLCADAWRRGELRSSPPYVVPVDPGASLIEAPTPPLTACILESGSIGVFPGGPGTCSDVGLPEAKIT